MSWNKLIRPIFFRLPAETAHYTAMGLFSRISALPGVASQFRSRYEVVDSRLQVSQFGLTFNNPVGLAAGFDKEGRWYGNLANLGFGSVEIGTVTGQAQPGNPKPRMFRLAQDKALINRLGFNSKGCDFVSGELQKQFNKQGRPPCVLGINIGKSKVVALEDAPQEYRKSFEQLYEFADYFTVNVSSPNTPNLRELQNRDHLIAILEILADANERLSAQREHRPKPILLKIAPDLSDEQLVEIAGVARERKLAGIIATNTTISRSGLQTPQGQVEQIGAGGLSGRPLQNRSLQVVATLYKQLGKEIPIVGVGGIMNGQDAWNMIAAGASLVQLYTGFIYGGPSMIRDINLELLRQIDVHKLQDISQAVGLNHG